MFTTSQLIKIFSKSEKSETIPETEQISDIIKNVNIDSGISPNGIDYYCRINLLDLSKSGISDDIVFDMAKNGWTLSKDRKFIEFIY